MFIVMPLLLVILCTFASSKKTFALTGFHGFVVRPRTVGAFICSVKVTIVAALIYLLLNCPTTCVLDRGRFGASHAVIILFVLPV